MAGSCSAPTARSSASSRPRDASPEERAIGLCNGGIMAIEARHLFDLVDRARQRQRQARILPDRHRRASPAASDFRCRTVELPAEELLGVNTRAELAEAEALMQGRLRRRAMEAGATLIAPETVFLSGRHAARPRCRHRAQCRLRPRRDGRRQGARIRSFSHLEGADGRSRRDRRARSPGCAPARCSKRDVHVGNFVEVKAARLGAGVKANHLSYLGDSEVGRAAPISAPARSPAITTAFNKLRTMIGEGAFIGSNTALVAPVTVGDGAYRRDRQRRHPRCAGRRADDRAAPGRSTSRGAPRRSRARLRRKKLMCGIIGIIAKRDGRAAS